MQPAIIQLQYRQVIDAARTTDETEKAMARAAYSEFLLKSQAYNQQGKYTKYTQMVAADGRVNSLHYKCGFSLAPYIQLLGGNIPGVLDNLGRPIKFTQHEHRLIEADITEPSNHRFSITYTTDVFTLLGTVQDYLVLTEGDHRDAILNGDVVQNTCLLKLVPGLSIGQYQSITVAANV